jgi:hypothetical protein
MKHLLLAIVLFFSAITILAQPYIHSHNDYQQAEPFVNAVRNKSYSIEADIYLYNNKLVVAHDKKELPAARTLENLYLQPIIGLFKKHKGTISKDRNYAPVLMIDIKENGEAVLIELIKLLSANRSVFDRSVNKKAMQVVISGDRTASSTWSSYPAYILFDGRPNEVYDNATMHRVAFISDSYPKYVTPQDSTSRLEELSKNVHGMGKLLRLWGSPDDPASWKRLQQLGIDIINTDKPAECRYYLYSKQFNNKNKRD